MKVFRVSFSTFFEEPWWSFGDSFCIFLNMVWLPLARKYLEVSKKTMNTQFGLIDFENKSIW